MCSLQKFQEASGLGTGQSVHKRQGTEKQLDKDDVKPSAPREYIDAEVQLSRARQRGEHRGNRRRRTKLAPEIRQDEPTNSAAVPSEPSYEMLLSGNVPQIV